MVDKEKLQTGNNMYLDLSECINTNYENNLLIYVDATDGYLKNKYALKTGETTLLLTDKLDRHLTYKIVTYTDLILQLVEFEYEEYFKIGIKVNITNEEEAKQLLSEYESERARVGIHLDYNIKNRSIYWKPFNNADYYVVLIKQNELSELKELDFLRLVENNTITPIKTNENTMVIDNYDYSSVLVFAVVLNPVPFKYSYFSKIVNLPKFYQINEKNETIHLNNKFSEIKINKNSKWDVLTVNIISPKFLYAYTWGNCDNHTEPEEMNLNSTIMKLKLDIANSTNDNCFRLFFSNTSLVSLPTKNAILQYELSENHYFIIILVIVICLLLIGGVLLYIFKFRKGHSNRQIENNNKDLLTELNQQENHSLVINNNA